MLIRKVICAGQQRTGSGFGNTGILHLDPEFLGESNGTGSACNQCMSAAEQFEKVI